MREILFKAKRISDGEWVSGGSFITFFDNGVKSFFMPQFNEKCTCEHDEITDDILSFSECRFYKVDPGTICQYTGLTDKHGNNIWENDIVEIPKEDDYFRIEWQEDTASFVMTNDSFVVTFDNYWPYEVEVVDSIFDNPELLKGGI